MSTTNSFNLPEVQFRQATPRNSNPTMEANITATVISVGVVVLLSWLWRSLNWLWLTPKKLERQLRQQGLKGNPYRLLHGDLKDYSKMTKMAKSKPIALSDDIFPRALPFLHHTIRTYGKGSFAWNGPTPVVNITDTELIKEVLTKMPEFPKTTKDPLAKLLAPGLPKYEGEKWAKHRKIMNPAFHTKKLKSMASAFCLSCDEMLKEWKKATSKNGPHELDVLPFLDNLAGDMLSRTLFGSSFEEGKKIFQLQKEQAGLTMEILRSTNIPGKRFMPTQRNRRMKAINKQIQDSLRQIIDKRKEAMEAGEAPKDDLLGMLLESNRDEIEAHGNNKKAGMTTEEVIDECKLIYFVGKESVSSLLAWVIIVLSQHQEWQERAREEVLQTLGKNEPDLEGLNHLKIVNMIIHEVLRLYPPVVTVSRSVLKEVKLGEVSLPAGVQVQLPIIMIHRDTEIWGKDAMEFKPERFSEGVSKAANGSNSFLPFGWGPRLCIGLNFAILEAKVTLSMILQRFRFELSSSYAHAPYTVKTLIPQHGAHILLHHL